MGAPRSPAVLNSRLGELDGLRGIAALLVVLYHYTFWYWELFGGPVPLLLSVTWGHYGVHLFFAVSGFVILMSAGKRRGATEFVISRVARLYPAYWVAVPLTFVVVRLADLTGRETSLLAAIVNMSMLQAFFGMPHVDGVYWTLTIELVFYFWIFVLLLAKRIDHVEKVIAIWLGVSLVLNGIQAAGSLRLPGSVSVILLLEWGHLFSAGMLLYLIRQEGWDRRRAILLLLTIVAGGIRHGYEGALVASVIVAVLSLLIHGKLSLVSSPAFVWLGSLTYALYLVHQNIGYVVMRSMLQRDADPHAAVGGALVVAFLLAIGLAKMVERPAQRLTIRWRQQRSGHA